MLHIDLLVVYRTRALFCPEHNVHDSCIYTVVFPLKYVCPFVCFVPFLLLVLLILWCFCFLWYLSISSNVGQWFLGSLWIGVYWCRVFLSMCYPKSSIWSKPTKRVCWSNSIIWFHGKKLDCLIGRSRSLVIGTWSIFKGFSLLASPVSLCWCWSISRRFVCLIRAVVLRLRTSIPSGSNSLCWIKGWGSFYFFLFYSVLLFSCLDLWWIVCVVMDQYGLSLVLKVFVMILYMYW